MVSDDPAFETKAADIIGLYLKPPAHAAVFCVDERGRFRLSIDWIRFCPFRPAVPSATALNTFATVPSHFTRPWKLQSGEILGKTAQRHTSAEFVSFLREVVATQPAGKPIHLIADNLSAHKTPAARRGLPGCSFQRSPPLYPNLFVLAQSDRKLVRQTPTPRDLPRRLQLPVRPSVVKLLRYIPSHYNRTQLPPNPLDLPCQPPPLPENLFVVHSSVTVH